MNSVNPPLLAVSEGKILMPQAFKHYEIRACLDANPHAPVYQAWDTSLHRMVVIKQLAHLGSEIETVITQARKAAALTHSAFVKIHALEEYEHGIFIVMELVKGVPLLEWMRAHQGQENLALIHIRQIALALQEAQAAGLIHGDLQPAHLMVDTNGKIRILNLGFTTHFDLHAVKNITEIDAQSSIAYLAPERFVEQAASSAADVFSLGMILYQMLLGATPFSNLRGLALVAAQAQTASEQWAWPASVSPALRELILGMTRRDTGSRLDWQQVQDECQKLVFKESSSASISQSKIHILQTQLNASKRRRYWRNGIVLAGLLGVCGVGIWQAKPNWAQIAKVLKPYAESVELEQAMQALAKYDKPGKLEEATLHFNTVLEHDANNARAVAGLSIVYSYRFRSANRDDVWRGRALASAQQALSLNPDLAITQIAYALALDPHRQFDIAMAAVEKAKKLDQHNLLAWQTGVRTYLIARQFESAIKEADNALKLFPHDWLISNLKGVAYLNLAKYEFAEAIFRENILNNPDAMLSYNFLAVTLQNQGRTEDALQVLQQGLQLRSDVNLYTRLGDIKYSQGDFLAAAEAYEKATLDDPQNYETWIGLANALVQLPNRKDETRVSYEKARKLLELRLEQRPNDGWNMVVSALVYARLGQFSISLPLLTKALVLAPSNPDVHFQAACAYVLLGKRSDALMEIDKAKQLGISEAKIRSEPILKDLLK